MTTVVDAARCALMAVKMAAEARKFVLYENLVLDTAEEIFAWSIQKEDTELAIEALATVMPLRNSSAPLKTILTSADQAYRFAMKQRLKASGQPVKKVRSKKSNAKRVAPPESATTT